MTVLFGPTSVCSCKRKATGSVDFCSLAVSCCVVNCSNVLFLIASHSLAADECQRRKNELHRNQSGQKSHFHGVVLVLCDNELQIVTLPFLQGYKREWNANPSLWPETCVLMQEEDQGEGQGDKECRLLFIGGEFVGFLKNRLKLFSCSP